MEYGVVLYLQKYQPSAYQPVKLLLTMYMKLRGGLG